jgi:HEAT repeat protein
MSPDLSIEALLEDPDPEARRQGATRIAELKGDAAILALAKALGDGDWRVRKEAAAVAPSIASRSQVIERLALALDDHQNVGLRNAAVEALILIGTDSVPVAIRALEALDADGRKLAVEVLGGAPDLAGTRALTRALSDPDENVAASAAEALGSASLAGAEAQELAINALRGALGAREPLRRMAALHSLMQLDANLPWQVFEPLAGDPLLRRHAIAAAGRTHDASAVQALARAVGDPSRAVARDALVALVDCLSVDVGSDPLGRVARHELRASKAAEERIRVFASSIDDSRVRGAALVALGLLSVRSDVPQLVQGLSDDEVSARAELGLRWFGKDAVSAILEEGRLAAPPVRAATLLLVPLLSDRPDRNTLEFLRGALSAEAVEVKTAALQAIAATGGGDDLPALAEHATSLDPRVAATASQAITSLASRHPAESRRIAETISPDSPVAVVGCLLRGASAAVARDGATANPRDLTFLRGALDHDDVRVRRAAVDALSAIGGPQAAVVVARALADEARDVVLAAVRALGRMGQAEPLLALLDGKNDSAVVASVLRALGEANPTRAFDAAWGLLRNEDALLAAAAVETIGQLRGGRRDEGLFLALDHSDPGVVKSAMVELSRDMSSAVVARLGLCLDNASYEVRRFAAELLADVDGRLTHALLRGRLDRESDPVVREALTLALSSRPPAGDS